MARAVVRTGARRAALALGALVLAASLGACSAQGSKPPVVPSDDSATPAVIVRAVDNEYRPREVTIKPGEAVQWQFEGVSGKHDVVGEGGSFVSELVYEGTYTHVFEKAGEYDYKCSIHPEMTGVVKVG